MQLRGIRIQFRAIRTQFRASFSYLYLSKKSLSERVGNKNPETETRNANKGFSVTQLCSYITPIAMPECIENEKGCSII